MAKQVRIQPRDLLLVCRIRVNNGVDMFLDPSWFINICICICVHLFEHINIDMSFSCHM